VSSFNDSKAELKWKLINLILAVGFFLSLLTSEKLNFNNQIDLVWRSRRKKVKASRYFVQSLGDG
jgi:hypothetical protein